MALQTPPASTALGSSTYPHRRYHGALTEVRYAHPDGAPTGSLSTFPGQKLIARGGIGVGNSAAATTPGSVVKKMEVFSETGASLGFIPIYSSIT